MNEQSEPSTEQKHTPKPRPKRTKIVKTKLFDDEYLTAQENAKKAGYKLATYARETLIKERIFNRAKHQNLSKFLSQIAWIGNNLNQLSYTANYAKLKNELSENLFLETVIQLESIKNELALLADLIAQEYQEQEQATNAD